MASSTPTSSSAGLVFGWPQYASQNFNYNGQYLNLYGIGFHGYDDGTSIGGVNAYISSYFGVDFFTAGLRRFRINTNGTTFFDQNMWVDKGATISSDFADADPGNSWNSNLSVRNNNNANSTFSRLSFVSQSGGFGAISVQKTDTYTGDMYFQVRNGPGFYQTPLLLKANGYVGIGTASPSSKLEVSGQTISGNRINGTSGDFEALSIYNTPASNLPSGNGAVIQFYNNSSNYNTGVFGASIKSVSVNNQYGWESDLYLRTARNNSYSSQTILDAIVVKGNTGNVGIGNNAPDAKLTVSGQVHAQEVKVTVSAPGPDYVFEKNYKLTSLEEIKNYIDKNKHLPEVPSAKEMEKNGVQLGEMNMLLLKKIEELTLYVIEQERKFKAKDDEIKDLKSEMELIKRKLK
jgi:hypothetical protein